MCCSNKVTKSDQEEGPAEDKHQSLMWQNIFQALHRLQYTEVLAPQHLNKEESMLRNRREKKINPNSVSAKSAPIAGQRLSKLRPLCSHGAETLFFSCQNTNEVSCERRVHRRCRRGRDARKQPVRRREVARGGSPPPWRSSS